MLARRKPQTHDSIDLVVNTAGHLDLLASFLAVIAIWKGRKDRLFKSIGRLEKYSVGQNYAAKVNLVPGCF